tara:strand:- start:430 stop:771 length:342 start_codon:yes stop_codon:yes gene_type:complete
MNLNELTKNIKEISKEDVVQKLADCIQEWKTNEKNVNEFRDSVERYLGDTRFDKRTDFDEIYRIWTEFRTSAIEGIGGMTMNERLYWFGLFDIFDNARNTSEQEIFYRKLMTK